MAFSHRDVRAAREIGRFLWAILLLVLVLGAAAVLAPGDPLRFGAVVGLAVAGGIFLLEIDRSVQSYLRDLSEVAEGGPVSGIVRAEVESDVDLDDGMRRRPPRSPTVRRRGPIP